MKANEPKLKKTDDQIIALQEQVQGLIMTIKVMGLFLLLMILFQLREPILGVF